MDERRVDPVRATEAWFIRRGLPMFVEDYNSARDIWTRAQPVLLMILAIEVAPFVLVAALPGGTSGPLWGFAAAAVVLVAFGAWSKLRRGYWFAPANRVGWPFLVFFLLAPTVAAALMVNLDLGEDLTFSWVDVWSSLLLQLVLLAIVYVFARYALLAMIWWAIRQTLEHFRDLYLVTTKALPFLLIVMIVLFVNTEMWQVAGGLEASLLWASVGMLLFLGLLVTFERTRLLVSGLDFGSAPDDVCTSCTGTPLAELARSVAIAPEPPRLARRQRGNLIVAAIATQAIQAALVGLVVWVFFMVFGVVAITLPVQQEWLGSIAPQDVYATIGTDHGITRALFRVSTFMAGFSAFYTIVYASTDETFRASFADDTGGDLQQAINVHRVYQAARTQEAVVGAV